MLFLPGKHEVNDKLGGREWAVITQSRLLNPCLPAVY